MDVDRKLEVGTSYFEFIEFSLVRRQSKTKSRLGIYGVDVTSVREVVKMPLINPLPQKVSGVAGVFELRGVAIPAINLAAALGDRYATITSKQQIIVTEFTNKRAGFIVTNTHRIRRISWDKVMPPAAEKGSFISGMTLLENNEFLFILDFEKLINHIEQGIMQGGFDGIEEMDVVQFENEKKSQPHVLLVDDTSFVVSTTRSALENDGYKVSTASDGLMAKEILESLIEGEGQVDVIVTDIEMPKMNGMELLQWVKEHGVFAHVPVIMLTSNANEENKAKSKSLGAYDIIPKRDIGKLYDMLKKLHRMEKQKSA